VRFVGGIVSTSPLQHAEQARLAITLRGIALAGWPVIFAQGEQRLRRGPRLGAAKRYQIAPEIAAAIDLDEAGQGHGGNRAEFAAPEGLSRTSAESKERGHRVMSHDCLVRLEESINGDERREYAGAFGREAKLAVEPWR
jgi:hypothetical protein